jgi:hypothetical protein
MQVAVGTGGLAEELIERRGVDLINPLCEFVQARKGGRESFSATAIIVW